MPQNKFEHAIIVGGSLGGLMMGLALSRSGYTVTILERADSSLRNGKNCCQRKTGKNGNFRTLISTIVLPVHLQLR